MSDAWRIPDGALSKRSRQGRKAGEQALKFLEQVYRIEKQARDERPVGGEMQADCIRRFRRQHRVPVLNALKEWLGKIAPKVLPDSRLEDAVSYTIN